MLKPALRDLVAHCQMSSPGVYFAKRGSGIAPQRLWLSTATHGQEVAGPIALSHLLRDVWRWPNVQMVATVSDPPGYLAEGYGFASIDGEESCWPPLAGYRMDGKGYWNYYDRNSLWGNTDTDTLPRSHLAERQAMATLEPTFVLSLHETVRSEVERDSFWAGAGLLVLETWPISAAEIRATRGSAASLVGMVYNLIRNWVESALGRPKYLRAARALRDNPHYQTVSEIVSRYEEYGREITGKQWTKYLAMSMDHDIILAPGRILHGPLMAQAEWHTIMDYALTNFGCPGVTTETFPTGAMGLRGLDQRVDQQLTFIHATLDTLDRKGT